MSAVTLRSTPSTPVRRNDGPKALTLPDGQLHLDTGRMELGVSTTTPQRNIKMLSVVVSPFMASPGPVGSPNGSRLHTPLNREPGAPVQPFSANSFTSASPRPPFMEPSPTSRSRPNSRPMTPQNLTFSPMHARPFAMSEMGISQLTSIIDDTDPYLAPRSEKPSHELQDHMTTEFDDTTQDKNTASDGDDGVDADPLSIEMNIAVRQTQDDHIEQDEHEVPPAHLVELPRPKVDAADVDL